MCRSQRSRPGTASPETSRRGRRPCGRDRQSPHRSPRTDSRTKLRARGQHLRACRRRVEGFWVPGAGPGNGCGWSFAFGWSLASCSLRRVCCLVAPRYGVPFVGPRVWKGVGTLLTPGVQPAEGARYILDFLGSRRVLKHGTRQGRPQRQTELAASPVECDFCLMSDCTNGASPIPRKRHPLALRLQCRKEWVEGQGTLTEVAARHNVPPQTVVAWYRREHWATARNRWREKQWCDNEAPVKSPATPPCKWDCRGS
jgi:hypothetical protein